MNMVNNLQTITMRAIFEEVQITYYSLTIYHYKGVELLLISIFMLFGEFGS